MKKLVALLLCSFGSLFALAQPKIPTAEELAKKNVDEIDTRLKLTPTQRSVVYNYAFSFAKEQLNLMKKQQATGAGEEDIAKLYRLSNETNLNIKAVLKPEQVKEYDKLIEERLSGIDPKKKKKKRKKDEDDEVVGIEGLKSVKPLKQQQPVL